MQSTCFIQQASLPSLKECLHEAETLKNQIRPVDCIRYYVVSSTPEVALEIGLEYVKGTKSQNRQLVCMTFPNKTHRCSNLL